MTEISTDLQEDIVLEESVEIYDGLPEPNLHVLIILKESYFNIPLLNSLRRAVIAYGYAGMQKATGCAF